MLEELKKKIISKCESIQKQNVEKWKIVETKIYVNLEDVLEFIMNDILLNNSILLIWFHNGTTMIYMYFSV